MEATRKIESKAWIVTKHYIQHFFSEMIGTAILTFVGCMGLCEGLEANSKLGAILAFGAAVFLGIQFAAPNSGGHVNPAITVVSLFFRKISFPMALIYIFGQLVGGVVGYGFLKAVTPSDLFNLHYEEFGVCTTVPNQSLSLVQAVLTEFLITSILLLLVCSVWDPRNEYHDCETLKLGFAVFALAYVAAPYTGASMNPARSFAAALWNHAWKYQWVYWLGPMGAAVFWGPIYTKFLCPKLEEPHSEANEESPAQNT